MDTFQCSWDRLSAEVQAMVGCTHPSDHKVSFRKVRWPEPGQRLPSKGLFMGAYFKDGSPVVIGSKDWEGREVRPHEKAYFTECDMQFVVVDNQSRTAFLVAAESDPDRDAED